MNVATSLSEFDELKAKVTVFVQPTLSLVVKDAASNAVASGTLKTIKAFANEINARRLSVTKPLNDKVKEFNDYAKQITQPLDEAEAFVKRQMAAYAEEEKKIRDREQARIDADLRESERVAAEQRRKIEADAKASREKAGAQRRAEEESQRLKFEAEKKAAADARALFGAGPADKAKEEAEAREIAARQERERKAAEQAAEEQRIALKARFDRETQEREKAAAAARSKLEAERPKNIRQLPKFEIIDASLVPAEFLMVDEVKVGASVRGGNRSIPGIRIWMESSVSAR